MTSSVSATEYQLFDNLGRMTQMAQITDGQTYTSKYTYNFSGALVEEEYPSGRKVKNEFESDGDISRIYGNATPTATERTYANTFSYTPDGRGESPLEPILAVARFPFLTFTDRQVWLPSTRVAL